MKLYELVRFGKLPYNDPEDDEEPDSYGGISQGFFLNLAVAQAVGEKLFLDSDKAAGSDTWIKEARVWAVDPRERPQTERLHLWSMLPLAAGSNSGEWYPQARTTHIWIETKEVDDNAPAA